MAWAFILVILTLLLILFYSLLKRNKLYWWKFKVIVPKPNFLFGNYKDVIMRRITHFEFHEEVYRAHPKEKVVGLYRFNTPVLLLRDLDVIQHVLVRAFDNFVNRGLELGERLSANLASCEDDTWRMLRTRFSTLFSSGKLKNMMHQIEKIGSEILEQLDSEVSTSMDYNVQALIRRFTVRSISACAFGLDVNKLDERSLRIEQIIFRNYKTLELFFICPNFLKKLGVNAMPVEIADYFRKLVDFIKEQRNGEISDKKDLIDLLLEMKNLTELKGGQKHWKEDDEEKVLKITEDLIAAQAMIFYGAGFDTTTNTLSYLLYELAKHPDIQEKLFQEIKQTLQENNGELSLDSLRQMTYMDQVFHETLRMYPILDIHRKVSTSSCQIPGVDINLKKGDTLVISVRGIHYDENYYPEPYKFDPERFSEENMRKPRHPCSYLPFGLGPRQCIGVRFAKLQSRIFLVKFLTHYKVEADHDTKKLKFDPMIQTLTAINGIPLKILRRN